MINKLMNKYYSFIFSMPGGNFLAIARHLATCIHCALRQFLLGETRNVLFRRTDEGCHQYWTVVHLSRKRWHILARLLTRRANSYQKDPRLLILYRGQSLQIPLNLDKKG